MEVDDDLWVRARGWALPLNLIAIPYYMHRHPSAVPDGQAFVAELLADSKSN